MDKYGSSGVTKEVVQKVFKPSEVALKVDKLTLSRNNGVKIVAQSPDLEKIKALPQLAKAGLKVVANVKSNPRIIIRGVPVEMKADNIRSEFIALNLDGMDPTGVKVIYVYPARDRWRTSCVLEIPPEVRDKIRAARHVYLQYSGCKFDDHIWIPQCFKCLGFGHLAKECKSSPMCDHCAGDHDSKECVKRSEQPICGNCRRFKVPEKEHHSKLDAKKCPVLKNKLEDRIANTNYG